MVLPYGNVTVAKVSDVSALKKENPVFYKLAKNGDHVLVYDSVMILYSGSLDRILDIWHTK